MKLLVCDSLKQPAMKRFQAKELRQDNVIDPVTPSTDALGVTNKLGFIEFAMNRRNETQPQAEEHYEH